MIIASRQNQYVISTRTKDIDMKVLHKYLSERSYWSRNIPRSILKRGIENSINFSVLSNNNDFIGFARIISDRATFAYLADVFILEEWRGNGLGKWLVKEIMDYSELSTIRTWILLTRDAHSLYEKYGWKKVSDPSKIMVILNDAEEFYNRLM